MPTSPPSPKTPSSNSKRKSPASLARSHAPAKRTKSTEDKNINSDTKRKAQVPISNRKSPNAAVQMETPNIYLVSQQVAGPPTPNHLTKELQSTEGSEDHHKSLFYEQLQLYYTNSNQRKLMGRDQLNEIIEIVKGDVTFTKGDAKTATMHYKYRKDFAVMKFGDHYSLVRSKDVVGKTVVDISTIPHYVCYKEL
jgi:hypothetical protein